MNTVVSGMLPFLAVAPAVVYSVLSLRAASVFFRRKKPAVAPFPPVTIIKPVKGEGPESFANFASFCLQQYDHFQIIFVASSSADRVLPVIRELMARFPDLDIDLVVDDRICGPNYKVCNLVNAFPRARHDIIIVSDSDTRVGELYLQELCAPFADPAVGLVSSLYRSGRVEGGAGAIEALGFTVEMMPNVMAAWWLEGVTFALGASIAVRREALERIGGFQVLADYLADDYQLGHRIGQSGYRIELSAYCVDIVTRGETLSTVLSRQLRWSRTMRVSRPAGYFASGMTQPALAAAAALLAGWGATGWAAVLLLYLVRAVAGLAFSRKYLDDGLLPKYFWLLPFRDLMAAANWMLAFAGNRVLWRGHRYRVLPDGRIEEVKGL